MYNVLSWKKFGARLIKSQDLDPVYVMLANSKLSPDKIARYCLALLLYSHEGVAARLSSRASESFFDSAIKILPDCPRGGVRRHFRGKVAEDAMRTMQRVSNNRPEWLVNYFFGAEHDKKSRTTIGAILPYKEVSDRVLSMPQMGKWAAFKMADMGDRLLGHRVDFAGCEDQMQKPCIKGAAAILHDDADAKVMHRELCKLTAKMQKYFKSYDAPPFMNSASDRNVHLAEIETILCKYSKHYAGRYPIGKDVKVVYAELDGYGKTARHLQAICKTIPAWKEKV